ncbi:MAG: hypothetical protein Q7T40_09485 [Methylobacter sp.]|nr:hypothetical protein [Methylobacter sp.]
MAGISANELKTKGVLAIQTALEQGRKAHSVDTVIQVKRREEQN